MNFIAIRQEINKITGEVEFCINAMVFDGKNGQQRKIPHPVGNATLIFKTIEEAKRAVELSGFSYVLPDGIQEPIEKSYQDNLDYDKLIFDVLMRQVQDTNSNIVATALSSLSEIGNKKCLEIFIEKMGEDNENIRQNSIDAIYKYGINALSMLSFAIKSENWVKRNSAIICIERICEMHDAPIDKIINLLLQVVDDKNPIIKCSAIKALGTVYRSFKYRDR